MRVSASNRRDHLRAMLANLKIPGALKTVNGVLTQSDSGAATRPFRSLDSRTLLLFNLTTGYTSDIQNGGRPC